MRHAIDPKIDCVFKALLGSEDNRALLIHFLNALLGPELPAPITAVEILDPYNEREFLSDKLSIVDVKARDEQGRVYQVEIQLLIHADLPARILYTWADLYTQQLKSGQGFKNLRPTYSIWLLGETLLPDDSAYAHRYRLRDERGASFLHHGGIALFELSKFAATEVATEEQRWLRFFKEGERLDTDRLPVWMQTVEMRQAMSTLEAFSEKDRAYHAYQARQNYLRVQMAMQQRQRELEQHQQELEQHQQELEQHQQELEQHQQELEQDNQRLENNRQELELSLASEQAAREAERQAKDAALAELARLQALLSARPPEGNR